MEEMTWPILLLCAGLGLLIAEVFLPSGGVLGVLAASSLVASLYLVSKTSQAPVYRWIGLEVALVLASWVGALFGLPRTTLGRRVYLRPPTDGDLDELYPNRSARDQVGLSGRTLTPLRPSGMIDLGGRRVEAMAESGLIHAGAAITVVAVRSGRAVVRAD